MSIYDHFVDDIENSIYNEKSHILKYVSERDIFGLVFSQIPNKKVYITSPFRIDRNPKCWFDVDNNNKLWFNDFGCDKKSRDCFDAVKEYYNLSNFYDVLAFIKERLIDNKNLNPTVKKNIQLTERKTPVKINIYTRGFNDKDKDYWQQYDISKQNLIKDKVFPLLKYKLLGTKKGNFLYKSRDISYAYTGFKDDRKKIYNPYSNKKFITNCTKDDIGGIDNILFDGKQLVISKSYKDYRVLKNQGLNAIWFQNEGMYPSKEILLPIIERFKKVLIFFDNDQAGINASSKLKGLINSIYPDKADDYYLPIELLKENIKDPSDLIFAKGVKILNQILIKQKNK